MDIDAYLDRIGYCGSRAPNARTLRDLQVAHLRTVPFENLSIHADEPIVLEEDALFEKIVGRRRGGFCYELNGLFAGLLHRLGFSVKMLSAGVADGESRYSPYFDHMALEVGLEGDSLEDSWLVEVGFGECFWEPLRLDDSPEQARTNASYRLTQEGEVYTLWVQKDGAWHAEYRFTRQPFQLADFVPRCHFHQTSPDSHFRRGPACTRITPHGRITVSKMCFITTKLDGHREERKLMGEAELAEVLRQHFGVVMD